MRSPMTLDPHAADTLLLHHAVHGATGLGVFVHDHTLYLHLMNEGERFVVDLTHGGLLIGGLDYEAVMHNAAAHYERAAVSLAGLAGRESAPVEVATDTSLAAAPFIAETVAESPELQVGDDSTPEPMFDMPRRRVLGEDDLPEWLGGVTGVARRHEVEEGWDDEA